MADLEGITVGGIPLKKHLEEEKKDEIQEAYNEELRERSQAKGRTTRKDKGEDLKGVSKRVRRLTPDEIRKEYGIMEQRHSKGEGGVGADCLWLIRHKSPMTANKAAEILGKTRATTSGIFSQLYNALGGKYIERGVTLPYEYRPLEEFDVIFAYKLVRKHYTDKSRAARAKARGEKPPEPAAEPTPKVVADPGDMEYIQDQIAIIKNQLVANVSLMEEIVARISAKPMGMSVGGTVDINVNFRWVTSS